MAVMEAGSILDFFRCVFTTDANSSPIAMSVSPINLRLVLEPSQSKRIFSLSFCGHSSQYEETISILLFSNATIELSTPSTLVPDIKPMKSSLLMRLGRVSCLC